MQLKPELYCHSQTEIIIDLVLEVLQHQITYPTSQQVSYPPILKELRTKLNQHFNFDSTTGEFQPKVVEVETVQKFYHDHSHHTHQQIQNKLLHKTPEEIYQYLDEHYQDLIHGWRQKLSETQRYVTQLHLALLGDDNYTRTKTPTTGDKVILNSLKIATFKEISGSGCDVLFLEPGIGYHSVYPDANNWLNNQYIYTLKK